MIKVGYSTCATKSNRKLVRRVNRQSSGIHVRAQVAVTLHSNKSVERFHELMLRLERRRFNVSECERGRCVADDRPVINLSEFLEKRVSRVIPSHRSRRRLTGDSWRTVLRRLQELMLNHKLVSLCPWCERGQWPVGNNQTNYSSAVN